MALPTTATVRSTAGRSASQPLSIDRLSFVGDSAYPTGGTTAFQAWVRARLGKEVTVLAVVDQGSNGYRVHYDVALDRLVVRQTAGIPAWAAAGTIASHAVTLATPGTVVGVDATTATAGGGKVLQSQATPAAGAVRVQYSAAGVATLTFNTADAVTVAQVLVLPINGSEVPNTTNLSAVTFEVLVLSK
jgi:hypothetical protein